MSSKDISDSYRATCERLMIEKTDREVKAILEDGIPEETVRKASNLLAELQQQKSSVARNKTGASTGSITAEIPGRGRILAEFELKAAAADTSTRLWYERTIPFDSSGDSGYQMDIVPYLDNPKTVSIVLSPGMNNDEALRELLQGYGEKEVRIILEKGNKAIMEACLQVAKEENYAEGDGTVVHATHPGTGKLRLQIQWPR